MEPVPDPERELEATCYRHPDRETLVRCSGCERPICTSCMNASPVGVRCPECAGVRTGIQRVAPRRVQRGAVPATIALVVLNVVAFALQVSQRAGSVGRGLGGDIATRGDLYGPNVADGEWWRIVTSGFLHAGLAHLAFNMIALWVLGSIFEAYVGPLRFTLIYFASVVWGSAGALLLTPNSPTVGASGGVFGLMAAVLVLQWQRRITLFSGIAMWLGLNLVITFTLPNISIGGHLGGIVGGTLAALVLSGMGRGHMAGLRLKPSLAIAAVAVILVGGAAAVAASQRATAEVISTSHVPNAISRPW